MRQLLAVGLVCLFCSAAVAAPDPDDWYQKQYAPLWNDKPWENLEAIVDNYADTVVDHPGDPKGSSAREWLAAGMKSWRAEGWLSSKVVGYKSDHVNGSMSIFKVKWRDAYEGGSEEDACGWYLADLRDDRWQFTHYADIDCRAHGL
ncbi:MAG: hypothetical protein AAGA23_11755 [Pseudomonadota bacterium]